MSTARDLLKRRQRRIWRVRNELRRNCSGRFRLSVFRSNKHIYGQVIDDKDGITIASASSAEAGLKGQFSSGGNTMAARGIGKILGERCLAKGICSVVFDRGGYKYHGRVAALADAAREVGLQF